MKYLLALLSVFLLSVSYTQGFIDDPVYDSLVHESMDNYDTTLVGYFTKYKPKYTQDPRDYTNVYIYHCSFVDSMGLNINGGKFTEKKKKGKKGKYDTYTYTKTVEVNYLKVKVIYEESGPHNGYWVEYKDENKKWKRVIPFNFSETDDYLIIYNDVMNQATTLVESDSGVIMTYNYYGYNSFVIESPNDMDQKLMMIGVLWYLSMTSV